MNQGHEKSSYFAGLAVFPNFLALTTQQEGTQASGYQMLIPLLHFTPGQGFLTYSLIGFLTYSLNRSFCQGPLKK